MVVYLTIAGAAAASLLSFFFSCLTYSLREYSRQRLAEFLGHRDGDRWFESITEHTSDLLFLTAVFRQLSNILIFFAVLSIFEQTSYSAVVRYAMTILLAGVIAIFVSLTVPQAAAKYAGTEIVGYCARTLHVLRMSFSPLVKLMHATDNVVRRALGAREKQTEEHIDEEILSALDEGEKEGFVDEQEREIIESVIEFRDTSAAHIMTTRPEIVALPVSAGLEQVKQAVEQSGHSRIPIFEGALDHVVGILHARDVIKLLGIAAPAFNARDMMRPPMYVPETKPLRDLLSDFRQQKVHIAVVLDEYGSTSGIVTIEDVLEELVGEIADEHEPSEPALFKRLDDKSAEADAKMRIEDLNRILGLELPEDAGYETLGGFLTTSLAKIPDKGAVYEHHGVRYTVLDAEPQRIKRVRIDILAPAAAPAR